jgi:NTP pyrophosphatase (non-canonical NTP hydrolase)
MGQPAIIQNGDNVLGTDLNWSETEKVLQQLSFNAKKTDWIADIAALHTKFGTNLAVRTFDGKKLRSYLQFRIDFLKEELQELQDAVDAGAPDDVVDALIDLCVVAIGTLNAFNVDAYEAWNRVHEKNMQKTAGVNPTRPNAFGFPDMIKPENWTPPTHADNIGLLARLF